jgi:hypothetical protein
MVPVRQNSCTEDAALDERTAAILKRFFQRTAPAFAGWDCETCNARFDDAAVHDSFLRPGVSLRQGVSEAEVTMQIDYITVTALVSSVLLLGYLTLTLLFPEKF